MNDERRAIALQYVTFAFQVIFMFLVAKWLGAEDQGRFALYRSFILILESVMWFGLVSGTTYYIASNFDEFHNDILTVNFAYLALLTIVAVVLIHAYLPNHGITQARGYFLGGWVLLLGATQSLQKIFLGQGKYSFYCFLNFFSAASLLLVLSVIRSVTELNIDHVLIVHVAVMAITFLAALVGHRKYLANFEMRYSTAISKLRDLYSVGMKGYISSIAFLLFYRVDFFFVGQFLGVNALGKYSIAVFIIEALQKFPEWLGLILTQRVASGRDPHGQSLRKYIYLSLGMLACASLVLVIFYLYDFEYGKLILGQDFAGVEWYVILLLPKAFIYCVMVLYAAFLSGHAYTVYHPLGGVSALVTLAALNFALIPTYGIGAAILSMTIANIVCTLILAHGARKQSETRISTI